MNITGSQAREALRLLTITLTEEIHDHIAIFTAVLFGRDPREALLDRWRS